MSFKRVIWTPRQADVERVLAVPTLRGRNVRKLRARSHEAVIELAAAIIRDTDATDPFNMFDLSAVVELWNMWQRQIPRVKPFYAVQCNPEPALLAALAALGAGFHCANPEEIESVLAAGAPPDRIIYANASKDEMHLRYAAQVGVNLITFDSAGEVQMIKKVHPRCSLLLGTNVPGALPQEIALLLEVAQRAGITVIGVSVRLRSLSACAKPYTAAVAAAKIVFNAAAQLGLPKLRVVNFGGVFSSDLKFNDAASGLRLALRAYFPDEAAVSVFAEPGHFLSQTAFWLVVNIVTMMSRGDKPEYWINGGIYSSMNRILQYHGVTPTVVPLRWYNKGSRKYRSTVFGETDMPLDIVVKDYWLPQMDAGDWLIFPNMGAYTAAADSNFNGRSASSIKTHLCRSS